MTPEELADIIINDKLEEKIMNAAVKGFSSEELLVAIDLLRNAIKIAIQMGESK